MDKMAKKRYGLLRYGTVVLCLCAVLFMLFPASVHASTYFTGEGTADDPFLLKSAEDLARLSQCVNDEGMTFEGQYFALANDIDMTGVAFVPIGVFGSGMSFEGTLDGNGFAIQNIMIEIPDGNNGLFGVLGGTVANLTMEGGVISGVCSGVISSHSSYDAVIINCLVRNVTVVGHRAGGIVDNFSGAVINCISEGCELYGVCVGAISSYSVDGESYGNYYSLAGMSAGAEVIEVPGCEPIADTMTDVQQLAETMNANYRLYTSYGAKRLHDLCNMWEVNADGKLDISHKAYSLNLGVWVQNNLTLTIALLITVALYLCMVFKLGPKCIYRDKERWHKRFFVMLAPVFLFFYMFFIHSPIEFFLVNNSEFDFVFKDFAWRYIIFAVLASMSLSAVLALIKGKACDFIACSVLGLDLAMYIQLNFLNSSLGLLDGTEKTLATAPIVINLLLWAVIILLPFLLFFILKKYRRQIIMGLCALLCFMQLTSITVSVVSSPESAFERSNSQYYFTSNDQFTVSANKNIIILVIDTYNSVYASEFMAAHPDVAHSLKDFTYYDNADCHYEGTVFSVNYLASGTEWDPSVKIDEWCKTAWDNERNNTFYSQLQKQGYIANFYTEEISLLSEDAKEDAMGKVANLVEVECDYEINNSVMLDLFVNASMYRYVPLMFKQELEFAAEEYSDAYRSFSRPNGEGLDESVELDILIENADYYQALRTKRLKTDDSSNYYILQHLSGIHGPYRINANGEKVEDGTLQEAEAGCWLYVQEYLNQLKALGVYDDATIIITADHGSHHEIYYGQPMFFIKTPNETHDQFVVTSAPISFTDMMPTVIYLAGGKYSDLGTTIFEHSEGELRERTLYVRRYDTTLPDVPKKDSPTNSILNCFYKYVYTGDLEDLRAIGNDTPTEKVPWTDAFY